MPQNKKMKMAREVRVAVRAGEVVRCPLTWTVDNAEAKIRASFELSGGRIEDQYGVTMEGTDVIGNAVGDLTFVGGRDLPPPQPAPVTLQPQPAGTSDLYASLM
jgi:hypothetical protein